VLRDQLTFMFRCGFDAYALRSDKDFDDALKAFDEFSLNYQGAVNSSPLFRRREAGELAKASA
jgi:uncharacterized protein (DUF934 family)